LEHLFLTMIIKTIASLWC